MVVWSSLPNIASNYYEDYPVSALTLACLSALLIGGHFYYDNAYKYWSRKGIKGPKPWPLVGNLVQVFVGRKTLDLELKWLKEYGKVYGMYFGSKPKLFVADPEVIRQICIKDFDIFPNHERREDILHDYQKFSLFFLQDDEWRKVRAIMSPTFTSGKIKRMFKLLDVCVDDIIKCFEEKLVTDGNQSSALVDTKDTYSLYTIDGVATCCYGLRLDRSKSKSADHNGKLTRDRFAELAMTVFKFNWARVILATIMPKSILTRLNFQASPKSNWEPLAQIVNKMVDARRGSSKKFDDYLHILLNTKMGDEVELNEMDSKENHHAGLTHESILNDQKRILARVESQAGNLKSDLALSELEILANAIFLLIVGVETTGTLLSHISYVLAYNQDVQERLRKDIEKFAIPASDGNFSFNYDDLTSCTYLDAVVSETLRFLPAVTQLDRHSIQDYYIEKYDVHIPKGTQLFLGFYSLLNDPDYWDEPRKFNPERFMPENRDKINPGSYCPFGTGPRHCIGMRFSLTETKLALAKILMRFRFEPAPGTLYPPNYKLSVNLNCISNSKVKIVLRE